MQFHSARKRAVEKPEPATTVLGNEIATRCRKCRAVTTHVITGKIGSKPTRVRCGTCELEHEYTVTRPRRAAAASAIQLPWAEALAKSGAAPAPYSAAASYRVGARITHTSFGEGIVVGIASATVCEVLFESRTVKLLMKGQPSGFEAPQPGTSPALRRGRRAS
ncbi:hypothetical protein K2Z84_23980 [Candidatus Binatia bacterium]|nr:hypothetical protein [Candidatus Binatia bacterium]